MKQIWYLSTCSTCNRIMNELNITPENFKLHDLKNNPIKEEDLKLIKEKTNLKFEELFNKRAIKYNKTNLKEKIKSDLDFKKEILKEYTFLKRPIIQLNNKFFVGNSKKVIEECKIELSLI